MFRILFLINIISAIWISANAQDSTKSNFIPINYAALLQDSLLEITLACGFTEEGKQIAEDLLQPLHMMNLMECRSFVNKRKFKIIEKKEKLGYEIHETTLPIQYPDENGVILSQNVKIRITFIFPGLQAKELFLEKLQKEEIVVYMGHGRRGVGPDFDAMKNPEKNIVFGTNSSLHRQNQLKIPGDAAYKVVATTAQNHLETITNSNNWKELSYRLWFFNACNTKYYLDEFRNGLLPSSISDSLDLFLTNGLVALYAGGSTSLAFIEALMSGKLDSGFTQQLFHNHQECLRQSGFYFEKNIQEYRPSYFYHQRKTPLPYFPIVKDEHSTNTSILKKINKPKN